MRYCLKRDWLGIFFTVLLLFFVFSFLVRTDHSFDQDLGRHIKLGEIILKTGDVPKTNLFSYTNPNFPFINHHFLFEILVYAGQITIGTSALLILKIIIILISVTLTLKIPLSKNPFLVFPLAFIFLHVLRERTELRPEIFSFLFTALTYTILSKFENTKTRLIYFLPVIQLLWINTHIYFPVGFIIQFIFLLQFYLSHQLQKAKTILLISAVSVGISLINPNHIFGLLYPLQIFGNYGYSIVENQNLFFLESLNFKNANFLFVKVTAILICASIIYAFLKKILSLKNLLLSLLGLMMALIHVRSFPYLVFISLIPTLENFSSFKQKHILNILSFTAILFLLGESFFYLSNDYYKFTDSDKKTEIGVVEHGKKALDFVLANNLPGPIFNNFDIGSYIIYRGYPQYKVFVDGRPEAYPKDFFQQIYIPTQSNYQLFKELDGKIDFQTVIFSHTDQTPWARNFLHNVTRDENWQIVFFDDFMIVLVKPEVVKQNNLRVLNLLKYTPDKYQFDNHLSYARMSLFLLNNTATDSAKLFASFALDKNPESPVSNLIMVNILNRENGFLKQFEINQLLEKSKNNIWW